MQTIEIRQNKKAARIILISPLAAWIGFNYYVYILKGLKTNTALNMMNLVVMGIMAYSIYIGIKRLRSDNPVLIFTKSDLTINENGNPESFLWLQIIEWKIENDDGTKYLKIQTADTTKKVSISWLEKKPREIKELMTEYSRK